MVGGVRQISVTALLFLATGTVPVIFLALLTVASWREKQFRAAAVSSIASSATALLWLVAFLFLWRHEGILAAAVLGVTGLVLLFFLPLGGEEGAAPSEPSEKVDERDTMFARAEYTPGTDEYDEYYEMRPENREMDDRIRNLPMLLTPGGRYYEPTRAAYVAALFALEKRGASSVDGPVATDRRRYDPQEISRLIKDLARHLGACEVGIAALNPAYVYSHVGRGPEPWGSEIRNTHPYAVAFTVEMDHESVAQAPGIRATEETALRYVDAQKISLTLAEYIRGVGYSARAHVSGSNYQIMLPPVARDAGLGEIGRLGYLISPKFGARIRLGAVTTELPLMPDQSISFGVQEFCEKCRKCAVNCPPGAIPRGDKTIVRSIEKWQVHAEKCYVYWRVLGTDCGLCMRVCPFSHPDSFVHTVLRAGIKRSAFARRLCIYGDDVFYGSKVELQKPR